jgi:hypothetical protein
LSGPLRVTVLKAIGVPECNGLGHFLQQVKRTHPAECVKVEEPKKISDVKGNRCGYATFRVKCSTR